MHTSRLVNIKAVYNRISSIFKRVYDKALHSVWSCVFWLFAFWVDTPAINHLVIA